MRYTQFLYKKTLKPEIVSDTPRLVTDRIKAHRKPRDELTTLDEDTLTYAQERIKARRWPGYDFQRTYELELDDKGLEGEG